jgi:hypothetical protein
MAIQQEIITHGLTLDTAYVKVSEKNWVKQAYEYLKTLDEFQGTEDV